jgi:hypothetical protein
MAVNLLALVDLLQSDFGLVWGVAVLLQIPS